MSLEQMPILRWEKPPAVTNPPPPGCTETQWDSAARQLREMSGVWAVIYEGPLTRVGGLASAIRGGKRRCWSPPGAYEAQQVRVSTQDVAIYARYVGDETGDGAS
jgi:hypothetical protein